MTSLFPSWKKRHYIAGAALLLCWFWCTFARATGVAEFFVAIGGRDDATGSAGDPFATIGRPQMAMQDSATRTTFVGGGVHDLKSTIRLERSSSGTSFIAWPDQTPVLDGAASGLEALVEVHEATNVVFSWTSGVVIARRPQVSEGVDAARCRELRPDVLKQREYDSPTKLARRPMPLRPGR